MFLLVGMVRLGMSTASLYVYITLHVNESRTTYKVGRTVVVTPVVGEYCLGRKDRDQ